jgi:hypothetical protein
MESQALASTTELPADEPHGMSAPAAIMETDSENAPVVDHEMVVAAPACGENERSARARRAVEWTPGERALFARGLERYGKCFDRIKSVIPTKNREQVGDG